MGNMKITVPNPYDLFLRSFKAPWLKKWYKALIFLILKVKLNDLNMAKFQRHKFEISTKSTISIILGSNQIDCEESQNRYFVTLGSLLKVPRLKATIKKKSKFLR